jgi:hypothetical protein
MRKAKFSRDSKIPFQSHLLVLKYAMSSPFYVSGTPFIAPAGAEMKCLKWTPKGKLSLSIEGFFVKLIWLWWMCIVKRLFKILPPALFDTNDGGSENRQYTFVISVEYKVFASF